MSKLWSAFSTTAPREFPSRIKIQEQTVVIGLSCIHYYVAALPNPRFSISHSPAGFFFLEMPPPNQTSCIGIPNKTLNFTILAVNVGGLGMVPFFSLLPALHFSVLTWILKAWKYLRSEVLFFSRSTCFQLWATRPVPIQTFLVLVQLSLFINSLNSAKIKGLTGSFISFLDKQG